MSAADRERWNDRYRHGDYAKRSWPTQLLAERIDSLPRGRALDLACGIGRNARFLAARGYRVDAVDISEVALAAARGRAPDAAIEWIECDLEDGGFEPPAHYDLIVNVRYVNLPLLESLAGSLRPGGAVLVEQHLRIPDPPENLVGPSTPGFRVAPGELARTLRALRIDHEEEGLVVDPDGNTAALARLIASAP